MPGEYSVRLTANGVVVTQPLTLKLDPRIKNPVDKQYELSASCYNSRKKVMDYISQVSRYQDQIKSQIPKAKGDVAKSLENAGQIIAALLSAPRGSTEPNLGRLDATFGALLSTIDDTDMSPTTQAILGVEFASAQLVKVEKTVMEFTTKDLTTLNKQLKKSGLKEIK